MTRIGIVLGTTHEDTLLLRNEMGVVRFWQFRSRQQVSLRPTRVDGKGITVDNPEWLTRVYRFNMRRSGGLGGCNH